LSKSLKHPTFFQIDILHVLNGTSKGKENTNLVGISNCQAIVEKNGFFPYGFIGPLLYGHNLKNVCRGHFMSVLFAMLIAKYHENVCVLHCPPIVLQSKLSSTRIP